MQTTNNSIINDYQEKLLKTLQQGMPENIEALCLALCEARKKNSCIFICGNGGSGANAIHIANDLNFVDGRLEGAVRAEALTANSAVLTCIANDFSYDEIFSRQLEVKAKEGDVLISLSGSGNSGNIVQAIEFGNSIGMKTFSVLGFEGGVCKEISDYPIHFQVDDMQVSEDLQLVVGHICMKYLLSDCMAANH